MKKRTIVSLVLLITCCILGYSISNSLISKNKEVKNIAIFEEQIINQLIDIRKAEKAYFMTHGEYTSNWDTLKKFILEDSFVNIERKEEIISKPYGGDSIVVTVDTLGFVRVKDSLFNNRSDLNINKIEIAPGSGATFDIYTYNSIEDNFIEVSDPEPINPRRQKGGNMKPLKFGSKLEASTKGSWEK